MARAFGRYELLRLIGRGGMADVFLARRRAAAGIEKRLVVKRIRRERAADPRFVEMFVKEARLTVDLAHANIVPVFDFGRSGDELFLAMEYVPGRDLAAALKRARELGKSIDPVLCAHVGAEACEGLGYAHRLRDDAGKPLGIVHRDVSPRNVLLSFAGEVKLVDFGVASLHTDDERGRVRGTLAYMPPEQARGEPVDGRADLFALGMVLAEALSGEPPPSGDRNALLAAAREGRVPSLPPTVPQTLRTAIRRATQSDRDARFADARAMHQALDAIVVAARAADPARPAPSQELAAWLSELFPDGGEVETIAETDEPGEGDAPAVSFLVEGADAVSRGLLTEPMGPASLRSIAETVAEGEDESGPAAIIPAPLAVAPPPPVAARRWPWLVVSATLIAAGAAAVGAGVAGRHNEVAHAQFSATTPTPPPLPDARPTAIAPPIPVVAPDARPIAVITPATSPSPPPVSLPASHPPGPRPASHPAAPPVPTHLYAVDINAKPWARVFIDGKYVDDTPFRAQLAPGAHQLRFENPKLGVRTRTVEIPHDGPVIENLAQ